MIWRGMGWAMLVCAVLFGGTVWLAGFTVVAAVWAVAVVVTVGLFVLARVGSSEDCRDEEPPR